MSIHRSIVQTRAAVVASASFILLVPGAASADETIKVSRDLNGNETNGGSNVEAISADGNVIAFSSAAWDLVPLDRNGRDDVFVFDRTTAIIERVSVASDGSEGDKGSYQAALSADGRFVAFTSHATNLVAGDSNGHSDIFIHDRIAGTTELVSVAPGGYTANGDSDDPSLSADGSKVVFSSWASNLVFPDTNHSLDVFQRDVALGTTIRVSVDATGVEGDDSSFIGWSNADGTAVAFTSLAANFPDAGPFRNEGVYLRDLAQGTLERVDGTDAAPATNSRGTGISPDGRFVAFQSDKNNLVPYDRNGLADVFVTDRSAGTIHRTSVAQDGSELHIQSTSCGISADGRFSLFATWDAEVVENDTNGTTDIFARDLLHGTTTRVSVGPDHVEGDGASNTAVVSADGRHIAFTSFARSFSADQRWLADVFLRDRCEVDASWTNYGAGFPGRNGNVPSLTASDVPARGSRIDLLIGNSSGLYTIAFLLVGVTQASIPTTLGGTLLVSPILILPVALTPSGAALAATVPDDGDLGGDTVDLQALEVDPFAAKGVSFSPGLELVIGL